MKSQLTCSIMLAITAASFAQITLTNANFPAVGDILKTVTVAAPVGIVAPVVGPNQVWMIAEQANGILTETTYSDAADGANVANYPNADLVVMSAGGTGETYYNATSTAFQVVGFAGPLSGQLPVETALQFNPPVNERTAPLHYGDISATEAAVLVPLSTDLLPDTLLSGLPIQPDSLRIRIAINRTEFVDAWGTMFLLGSNAFEVLRTRRFEETETRLDALLPFVGWLDVTDLIQLGFLGKDTTLSYIYLSNIAKEPIAIYNMNNAGDTVTSIQYKDVVPFYSQTADLLHPTALEVAPNPAQQQCTVRIPTGMGAGSNLVVTDMLGRNIYQIPVGTTENQISLDVSTWQAGNYTISLTDKTQQKISRARITVAH